VNSSGYIESVAADTPRFDYNPVNGQSLGLLIEEQRTNLFVRSAEFDNASWTKSGATVTANTALAPDNTTTGDKIIPDSGATITNALTQQIVTPAAGAITISFYAKAAGYTLARILNRDNATAGNAASVTVSLVDGSIVTAATAAGTWSGASALVSNQGNGWYRISLTYTTTNVATRFRISFGDAGTGDGTSGIFVWGAQLEAGAFATSYIPTVASQVTRTADVATMTGTNFSDWYNATEGAAVVEANIFGVSTTATGLAFYDATITSNYIYAQTRPTFGTPSLIRVGGVQQLSISSFTYTQPCKVAIAYKTNNFAASVNGQTPTTDTTVTIPTVDRAQIGGASSADFVNGHFRKVFYYPQRLTNAEVQAFSK
jgi:hypothetical protein